jgi:hypothetical protein
MPNGLKMDIDTFHNLKSSEAKLDALYDALVYQMEHCNKRFLRVEGRKKVDTGISAAFGFIGGAVAMLGKKLFGG